jgi:predicted extracellular nuclease
MCRKRSKKKKQKEEKKETVVKRTEPMEYYFAWWNVENLFDVEDYEHRTDKLKRAIGKEVTGWTAEILDKKLVQLAEIITGMNDSKGPDLLGVCEVENENVLKKLVAKLQIEGRDYQVAHNDCADKRGIDVAFIFDGNKLVKGLDFAHVVMKRVATRDIYQVNFSCKESEKEFVVIGNHWPSRRPSPLETEPYRIVAAETLAYWNFRIHQIKGDKIPVIVMGDFNDEPFNRSITDYMLGSASELKVLNARKDKPRLFNLMWEEMGKGIGTYYYEHFTMLDQFLVSKGLLHEDSDFTVLKNSVEIISPDKMKEGQYGKPIRFGRPKSKLNEKGYSDHFPIGMKIIVK